MTEMTETSLKDKTKRENEKWARVKAAAAAKEEEKESFEEKRKILDFRESLFRERATTTTTTTTTPFHSKLFARDRTFYIYRYHLRCDIGASWL